MIPAVPLLALAFVTLPHTLASENDRALVVLVTIGDRRILLAADTEGAAEHWLTTSGLDLRADELVVPHHGSKTSSTTEFLAAVGPRTAVISVGARNSYGTPARRSSRDTRTSMCRSIARTPVARSRCAPTGCDCGYRRPMLPSPHSLHSTTEARHDRPDPLRGSHR